MKVFLYYHELINPQIKPFWEDYFKEHFPHVEIVNGDICEAEVDAIVSPANSYGFMCGGLDGSLTQRFGSIVSERIQNILQFEKHRELLIGEAISVPTGDKKCPNIICAPTMIVPMNIENTINVYLSTRGALNCAIENGYKTIAFSAMGLGVGQVSPEICARQMERAYEEIFIKFWTIPRGIYFARTQYLGLINDEIHNGN